MSLADRPKTLVTLWGPVVLYLGLITFLSHQPSLTIPGGLPDWLAHGVEYGALGALLARIVRSRSRPTWIAWGLAAAGCAAFGVIDEMHQSFVPGRDASLHDVAADAGGAALALGAAALIHSRRQPAAGVVIAIYGRRDCHLCDEAERVVRDVAGREPVEIHKVDVDEDPVLRRLYGEQVPVVLLNGHKLFKLHVDPDRLRRKLRSLRQGRSA